MQADQGKRVREDALRRGSKSLGELLDRDPEAAQFLGDEGAPRTRVAYESLLEGALQDGGFPGLRRVWHRAFLGIAAHDLAGEIDLEVAAAAIADLADACLHVALATLDPQARVGVVAMGKHGGRELNYSSDIDVMFVATGDLPEATKVVTALIAELGTVTPEGQPYRIDANLRPEGRSGPLVRSLDGYLEYYRRWAEPWEFQALIKARGAAGNRDLAASLVESTRSLVWPTEVSPERVAAIRKMKERVEEHALRSARRSRRHETTDVKLGPGGIRDIEFSAQLLQLVHGVSDVTVRGPNTLDTLSTLVAGGYMAEDDGAGLAVAYRWLRSVEHRQQLWQERQVHHLPPDEAGRQRLALVMGFKDTPAASASERFEEAHHGVLADVRGRFEKLFYRPMIESLADPAGPRLSEEALRERLHVLSFRDVDRAARNLAGLVSGTSRRAKLLKVLTPALLRFLATTPLPDEGLLAFLRLSETLESRLDVLGALRDNPPALDLLARVLGSGKLLGEVLLHVPEEVSAITNFDHERPVKSRDRFMKEAEASLGWRDENRRLDGLRRFKRREMLALAVGDVARALDESQVGEGLSHLADACLEAGLSDAGLPFTVIGMGKLGGRELTYASDIDVMFVHDVDAESAEKLAETLMKAIGEVTPEGQAFRIDAGLRPEGRSGALARSFQAYVEYYERWARPWERLALLKARVAAGESELGRRFLAVVEGVCFDAGVSGDDLGEIRHLKARMERERIPRGVDPRRHIKIGPGGTSDIEFAIQLLQLQHARSHEELRVTGTVETLHAARSLGLLPEEHAELLEETYRWLAKLRNRLFLMYGRPTDALPSKPEALEALGIAMGFEDQARQEVEEAFLRFTRRARKIASPLIYGTN